MKRNIMKKHIFMLILFLGLGIVLAGIAKQVEEEYVQDGYGTDMIQETGYIDKEEATALDATSLDATATDADIVYVMSEKEIEDTYVEKLISEMTMEEKIAQLFLVACPTGIGVDVQTTYQFGGYLLFSRDFDGMSAEYVQQVISSYQEASKIPMIIAVDEEGGTVCRVSNKSQFRSQRFSSPRKLYDQGGIDAIVAEEEEKAELLKSLGINVNMNPVCDISLNTSDFMYDRSLGQSPETTSDFVVAVMDANKKHDMGTVLKHFPGYGNNIDTHTGVAIDDRPYETFETEDFKPFIAGINNNCQSILVSHNIINCMDSDNPASLSPEVHRILREDLNFNGVIITDDLSMQAVKRYASQYNVAVASILAGNDMVCCHDYGDNYAAVKSAVEEGIISEARINESVGRILHWKIDLGVITIPTE